MDKFKIKDRIDELKSAGEHGKVIKQKGGNKDKQTAAILRRSLRLKDVESGQSDSATMAGMKAFNQARQAGKDADAARTAQATASAEVRRASRAKQLKAKREDSHTVYEYIGAILAESLGLVEAFDADHEKRRAGREAAVEKAGGYTPAERARVRKMGPYGRKIAAMNRPSEKRKTKPLSPEASAELDAEYRDKPTRRRPSERRAFGGRFDRYGRGPKRR
jgi:hypothetical protein